MRRPAILAAAVAATLASPAHALGPQGRTPALAGPGPRPRPLAAS